MTEEQKYLFDLQGYIVLKNVVSSSVVEKCNKSLDHFEDIPPGDFPPPLCLGTPKTEKELYISNILEADTAFNFFIDGCCPNRYGWTLPPESHLHYLSVGGWVHRFTHARYTYYPKMPIPLPKRRGDFDLNQGRFPFVRLWS